MKAPSPTGKALSRRSDTLFATLFTTFCRRLPGIALTECDGRCSPPCLRTWQTPGLHERLRIAFYVQQNFPGDDFGVSKVKVMQACLNKFSQFIVRRIGAFAVLEHHHRDTDTFASIQYIIGSEAGRSSQDLADAAFGAASSIRNRTNPGVLSHDHVHEATMRLGSRPTHQSISGRCWTRGDF
jgi:hypothetical protein